MPLAETFGRPSWQQNSFLSEQSRSSVAPVVSSVASIIASVFATITSIVASVVPLVADVIEQSRTIVPVFEQGHRQAPFEAASRSASTAAISAWVGMRPLVTS
jgi:hypothetical protein